VGASAVIPRFPADVDVADVGSALDECGAAIVERFLSPEKVAALKAELEPHREATPLGRNDFEGFVSRRVYALFAKTRGFDELAIDPLILGALDHVLGPHYQLSGPVGIDVGPGETPQGLHQDDVVYPLPFPHQPVVLNTMWALDEFTEDNGATLVVPGSHGTPASAQPDESQAVKATMPAGSVMLYVGSLWHGGGANTTDEFRLGVILEYVVSWLRAQETHLLVVPPDVVATLPPRLQELLGYNIYPPFLGYVDGRHPRRALGDRATS
jgi:ectoine hydroxylase-related dioxygenase (phytanoyl-CoA dioxygenase family)